MSASQFRAVVFDAYGTLFDVHSVASLAEQLFPGKGEALSQMWRSKQLEYAWLRTMSRRYKPFWEITRDALRFSCERLGIDLDESAQQRLMNQYSSLSAFPENLQTLRLLRQAGLPLGILSNGNRDMVDVSVRSAGMTGLFEHILSAETVQRFKTDDAVYALAPKAFSCRPEQILFVSSNGWDAIGARWFGFTSFWINRAGLPLDRLDEVPQYQGSLLSDILPLVLPSPLPR